MKAIKQQKTQQQQKKTFSFGFNINSSSTDPQKRIDGVTKGSSSTNSTKMDKLKAKDKDKEVDKLKDKDKEVDKLKDKEVDKLKDKEVDKLKDKEVDKLKDKCQDQCQHKVVVVKVKVNKKEDSINLLTLLNNRHRGQYSSEIDDDPGGGDIKNQFIELMRNSTNWLNNKINSSFLCRSI